MEYLAGNAEQPGQVLDFVSEKGETKTHSEPLC